MRSKANFAYFTGTNRTADLSIIQTMIKSARTAGVLEDFHVFAPQTVPDSIHHPIPTNHNWRSHMAKIEFLRKMVDTAADYFVWLDTDHYFVRDPGDLKPLIRDNKCFVSMEGDITSPNVRQQDWWALRWDRPPLLIDIMRSYGCGEKLFSTNGGMWIVRRDAITEFADKVDAVFADLVKLDGRMSDEPPLAIVGQTLVPDFERNTVELTSDYWACDWIGRFHHALPDGNPWQYVDWLTGKEWQINPAIVHNMRGKHLMQTATQQPLSLLQRAASVTSVVGSTVINGGQLLGQEAINARQAICATCPNYTGSGCQLCGCQATRDAVWSNKLAHASARCPMEPPAWREAARLVS